MQGVFLAGQRPPSKKAIKEAIEQDPKSVVIEATAYGEFDGRLSNAPVGTVVYFVGPDPRVKRVYYGTITVTDAGIKIK